METNQTIKCKVCKKTKVLSEQKELYYEGSKKDMSKNLICEECFPKIYEEIKNESINVTYIKPTIAGILATLISTALFFPVFSVIERSNSVLYMIFTLAAIPGAIVFASMYYASGKKRSWGLVGTYLILILLANLSLNTAFIFQSLINEYGPKLGKVSYSQILSFVMKHPNDPLTLSLKDAILANSYSEFSLIILGIMLIPVIFFKGRKLYKVL